MKNFILILITTFTLSCCSKDDKPTNTIDQLPTATQTGANTVGCLVDGKAILPKGYIPSGNPICNYIDGKDFSIGFSHEKGNEFISIGVISYNKSLVVGQIYQLKEYGADSNFGEYRTVYNNIEETRFSTNATINGELKITYHNFDKAILSGTFWFDAISKDGKIAKIREGRFDMHY
jgi:hypothetical protein